MDNTFFHDKQLEEQLNETIILPPAVEKQMHQAYDRIASGAVKQKKKHKALFRTVASLAACVAVVGTIGVVNPAFAAQLPFVGSIFEYWSQQEQQALEQSGHTKKAPIFLVSRKRLPRYRKNRMQTMDLNSLFRRFIPTDIPFLWGCV